LETKILIADDDLTSRELLEAILTKWGLAVISAQDGDQAWEVLQAPNPPKLAILDWMMPGMDGADICRNVRQKTNNRHPYLILLTTKNRTQDIIQGLNSGANDYVTKPFNVEELRARIDVGFRVIELQDSLAARIGDLEKALERIKTLEGLLPLCVYCHKIRTDDDWHSLEDYIEGRTKAEFSHSLCPDCLDKHYPDVALDKRERRSKNKNK
jgi:DNA-binding response OmpR family regulator